MYDHTFRIQGCVNLKFAINKKPQDLSACVQNTENRKIRGNRNAQVWIFHGNDSHYGFLTIKNKNLQVSSKT